MVMRDKDDPRNNEPGERGPGGVRMVIPADLFDYPAEFLFKARMNAPGSPMFEELSKMKVRGEPRRSRVFWDPGYQSG
jgi:hypothetical protein